MKLIFTLSLIFLSTFINAQDRIGEFIINKTNINIIHSIENDVGKLEITNDLDFYNSSILEENKPNFCEIILDKKCEKIRLFYISQYFIGNLEIDDVYLFFHNDTLIQLVCKKSFDIEYFFTKKYGKPFKFEKKTPKTHSSTMEYDEHITELLWKKGNVKAISYQNIQLFDGIPRDAGSYFIICNNLSHKIIRDCDNFKQ